MRRGRLRGRMISVVVPTLNSEAGLAATLSTLVPAAVDGLVRQVIVVDGGASDRTLRIAEAAGAEIVQTKGGRGKQLIAGAEQARFPWLLFLHSDTMLEPGWEREAAALVEGVDRGQLRTAAAAFRFELDDRGFKPRVVEAGVSIRCALFRLPYGDQGLLIPKRLYDQIGGYRPMPVLEDVDIVRRLGRSRILILRSRAVTSAIRYRRDGYARRVLRNFFCMALFYLRVPASTIARIYE
jgi:rSAM/selenodomain-associated transferase 2